MPDTLHAPTGAGEGDFAPLGNGEASPLPWSYHSQTGSIFAAKFANAVARMAITIQADADAALIVRAVNHHQALVESVRDLSDALDAGDPNRLDNELIRDARELLKRIET